MIENILAARYAKAIGAIAQKKGILDRVFEETEILADIAMPDRGEISVPELIVFLHAPRIPLQDKIRVTDIMLEKMNFTEEVGNLLNILIRRGRVNLIGHIANNLRKQIAALKGIITADIESARPLTSQQLDQLKEALELALNEKIDFKRHLRTELLGGVRIRIGDQLLDGSVAGRLDKLETILKT